MGFVTVYLCLELNPFTKNATDGFRIGSPYNTPYQTNPNEIEPTEKLRYCIFVYVFIII